MVNFPTLTFLLLATIIITFVNFYFWFRANKEKTFNWLIFFLNIFLFVHAIFVFTIRHFFPSLIYFNTIAPFVLVYGPLLYIAIALIRRNEISKTSIYGHLSLPILFWLICIWLMLFHGDTGTLYWWYNVALAIFTPMSLIAYACYGIAAVLSADESLRRYKLMVMPATLLLIFMSVISIILPIYISELSANAEAMDLISMMIYSLMLALAILIFKYKTSVVFSEDHLKSALSFSVQKHAETTPVKYERSTLSDAQLMAYQQKLQAYMIKHEPYLDAGLSLTKLAKQLKMPSHHLTQVLSTQLAHSFYSYVNGFRIDYAISQLKANKTKNMTDLAIASGFSSKVSFYRQFKLLKGCTPAVYQSKFL